MSTEEKEKADDLAQRVREFHQTCYGMGLIEELAACVRAELEAVKQMADMQHNSDELVKKIRERQR